MTDFGTRFKKAREGLGVSLDKIAAETRISTRFLRAIEDEDFHVLPGGIFNRGFIRTYAQRVGLDPDQVIADYERMSSSAPESGDVLPGVEEPAPTKSQLDFYPIAIGALALLILIFYVVNRNSAEPDVAPASVAEAPASTPSPAIETPAAVIPQPETVPIAAAETPPVPEPAPAAVSPGPSSTLVLELEASGVSWIRLSADGAVVEDVILQPGHTRRYTAQNTLDISIGNAGGITMKVNGRDVGSLGAEGRARKFLITPDNAATIRG